MYQDFRSAQITAGAGGAGTAGGSGGRGGDVGSHNSSYSSVQGSNNDNRYQHYVKGDNYDGTVYQGDNFTGPIDNSIVGGRGNTNSATFVGSGRRGEEEYDKSFLNAMERIKMAKDKIAQIKKEKECREQLRIAEEEARELEEEAKRLEVEIASET